MGAMNHADAVQLDPIGTCVEFISTTAFAASNSRALLNRPGTQSALGLVNAVSVPGYVPVAESAATVPVVASNFQLAIKAACAQEPQASRQVVVARHTSRTVLVMMSFADEN